MVNPYAGEVALVVDGERRVMKLTLGALAELEAGLDAPDLVALIERFELGRVSTRDVLAVIVAGLRGAGWSGGPKDLLTAEIAGGPTAAAQAAGACTAGLAARRRRRSRHRIG